MALGDTRSWGCLCDLPGFTCPYHIALEHPNRLRSLPENSRGSDMPLFPTIAGFHPNKVTAVATFERLGTLMGQPLVSVAGHRLFDGHTPRVKGAQTWAAMGIEIKEDSDLCPPLGRHYTPLRG